MRTPVSTTPKIDPTSAISPWLAPLPTGEKGPYGSRNGRPGKAVALPNSSEAGSARTGASPFRSNAAKSAIGYGLRSMRGSDPGCGDAGAAAARKPSKVRGDGGKDEELGSWARHSWFSLQSTALPSASSQR